MKSAFKFLFIAVIFTACHNIKKKKSSKPVSNEKVDTIKITPAKIEAKPLLFETAFINGTTTPVSNGVLNFYGITIGKLKITSGHIIACDPMLTEEYAKPFTQIFPTGEFPVQLAIAKVEDDETIAYTRINFSDEPVAKWEYALLADQTPITLDDKKTYGYVVDSGNGLFMDEETNKHLDVDELSHLGTAFYKQMDKHYHNNWKYSIAEFGNYNLAVFSAGFGDGHYSTFIGFDAAGKPCRLLTDFGIVDWKK